MIQELGHVSENEMFHVFNMGIGMCVAMGKAQAVIAQKALSESYIVGEIVQRVDGKTQVQIID